MKPGVLLIHGFTSNRSSLEPLIPDLERLGIQWEFPILAGHGTRPEDLTGKRWSDWQGDVRQAYLRLRQTNDQIVAVALSMGTLLAIQLAAEHRDHIAGLVLISPAIMFKNKLAPLTPLVAPLVKKFPFPPKDKFSPAFRHNDRGYQWFPTAAYRSYWEQTKSILNTAATVPCPVRIIHTKADMIADPRGAQRLYDAWSAPKELIWFEGGGHEMLLDQDAEAVKKAILEFSFFQ